VKNNLYRIGGIILGLGLLTSLASCKEVSRFKQETFSCALNATGIFDVVVRSINPGDDAIVTSINGETRIPITESSDNLIMIADNQTKIVIDRQTKRLRVTVNDTLYRLDCQSSVFKM
jgi:hypothetical protein